MNMLVMNNIFDGSAKVAVNLARDRTAALSSSTTSSLTTSPTC